MDSFSNLFKKENIGQLLLSILFLVYLIVGYDSNNIITEKMDNIYGKIILVSVVLLLFLYANPILAVLALLVAIIIVKNGSVSFPLDSSLRNYLPTEEKKSSQFNAYNQFPYTLEQEIVKKMAPKVLGSVTLTDASYKPILDNLHDASDLKK